LISQGGQIEVQTDYGDTALMRAARFGHTETVEFLVEKKATILTKNQEGKTAADIARENKHAGDPATTINALETAAGRGNLRDQNSRRKKLH
jgi:ankyrin repeat protein